MSGTNWMDSLAKSIILYFPLFLVKLGYSLKSLLKANNSRGPNGDSDVAQLQLAIMHKAKEENHSIMT